MTTDLSRPPFTADWSQRFTFGHAAPVSRIQGICLHTTENDFNTSAEAIANYQLRNKSSYHVLVDAAGRRLRCNTDDWTVWATGNRGNDVLLHIAFVARARFTRQQWLGQDRLLRSGALYVAHWAYVHKIPVVALTPAQLRAGQRGITTHDGTRIAWGGTDHTDPGPGFPMDVFLRYVREYLAWSHRPIIVTPTPAKPKSGDEMTPEQARQLEYVYGQLRPWPQLGKNDKGQDLTLVDAVAALRADVRRLLTALEARD